MIGYLKNYASTLLKQVGYEAPIKVDWSDDTSKHATASTNGIQIEMPREFLGVKLDRGDKKRPTKLAITLAKGLILHEIGHSLQPLTDITKLEQATGLNHAIINIALDVHLERVALVLYKKEAINLLKLRSFIWSKMRNQYKADYPQMVDFPNQAQVLGLIGRYRFTKKPYAITKKILGIKTVGKLRDFDLMLDYTPGQSAYLCAHLQQIAISFPELCDPDLDLPPFPTMKEGAFSDGVPSGDDAAQQLNDAMMRTDDILETVYVKVRRGPAKREAIMLAAKLRMQLSKAAAHGRIIAPVTMDRRKMATGDDQPWFMNVSTGKSIDRSLTILFDVSGSMNADGRLEQAIIASQALCLAVESEKGSVCGGQFGKYGILTPDLDAALLFSGRVSGMDHQFIQGGTSFQLLADVWLKRPDDTIIVITDGDGTPPALIKSEDKKRTHVICLGGTIYAAADMVGHTYPLADNELNKMPEIMIKLAN